MDTEPSGNGSRGIHGPGIAIHEGKPSRGQGKGKGTIGDRIEIGD